MAKIINWIYGLAIIYVALDAMFIPFLPESLLPFIVILLGLLVFITSLEPSTVMPISGAAYPLVRPRLQFFRRRVFGVYMILSGLASVFYTYLSLPVEIAYYTSIYNFSGQVILLLIGVIYSLAGEGRIVARRITSF